MEKIYKLWQYLVNLGTLDVNDEIEAEKIKIVNYGSLILVISCLILSVTLFFNFHFSKIIIILIASIGGSFVLYYNSLQRQDIAKAIFVIFFPILIFLSILTFGESLIIEHAYISNIVITLMLFDDSKIQNKIIAFIIILFVLGKYIVFVNGPFVEIYFYFIERLNAFCLSMFIVIKILLHFASVEKKQKEQINKNINTLKLKNLELTKANEELERYAYIASHDLKSPLRTIVSYIGLMERKIEQKQYEEIPTYLNYVKDSGKKMHDLVHGILNFSRFNLEKTFVKEEVNLNDVLNENILKLNVLLVEKNVVIEAIKLPKILSNQLAMNILFQNLIENGIKYNKNPFPKIKIECNIIDEVAEIRVKDNGIGIDSKYHNRIFNLFERLSNDFEGAGIGLGMCKKIIENLEGDIYVESELGFGSTFIIKIPQ